MTAYNKKISCFIVLLAGLVMSTAAQQNVLRLTGVTTTASKAVSGGNLGMLNDGNTGGGDVYWATSGLGDSLWIQCQLPSSQAATAYRMFFWQGASANGARQFLLYGSADGINWTRVHQGTANADPVEGTINNTTSYTYYRFVFKQYVGTYLDFYEIELYNNVIAAPVLAGTSPTGSQVNLTWNQTLVGSGAYELEKSLNGTTFTPLFTAGVPATTYTDNGVVQVTSYWYRIRAVKGSVTSPYSAVFKITTASDALVTKPTLAAAPGATGTRVNLNWGLAPFNTPGTFELEKSTDGTSFTLFKTFDKATTSYIDSTVARSTTYWYRVRGANYTSFSPYSEIAKVTTISDSLLVAPTLTANASATIGTQARLEWALNIVLPGTFEVEKSLNGTDFTLFKTFDKTILTYTDSTLTHNTSYWYRVRGRNEVSPSPYSIVRKITTRNDSLLAAPALQANAPTGTRVILSWTPAGVIGGEGGFEVEKSLNGTDFTLLGKFPKNIFTYTEESLTPNTDYWYRIRAYNYINKSPYSVIVKVTTNAFTSTPADITDDGGRLFVSADNSGGANAGEGSSKFIDNNKTTKWLVFTTQAPGDLSAVYRPVGSYIVTSYSLTTANDSPERDPKDWRFEGSSDSTNWVVLDTRTSQLGSSANRLTTFNFAITNPGSVAYKFYRIVFTANNGPGNVRFQVSEWEIFGLDAGSPGIPRNIAVTGTTVSTVSLNWTAGANPPTLRYVLQRSLDGLYFSLVDTLPASTLTYTDTALFDSTYYYYRVQALGNTRTAVSGWSNVAVGLTKFTPGTPLAPVNLKVTGAVDTIVNLSWTDRSFNEAAFRVQRSLDRLTFTDIRTLPANSTAYSDSTVWPATKYYYRVAAMKDQLSSGYSNIDSVVTPGFNSAPRLTAPLLVKNACANNLRISVSIGGLIPGVVGNERTQQLRVTKVVPLNTASAAFFSSFSFTPAVTNGVASFSFVGSGTGTIRDTATILVTIKDNGGTNLGGVDSVDIPVKVTFVPLAVTISADRDITRLPKYVSALLTAATNYPSTTPNYSWTGTDGIVGNRSLITLRVLPLKPTVYTVTATSIEGCRATAQVLVTPDAERSVANVLTPDGDGKNDKWIVWGITQNPGNEVKVFDRAGRIVFQQKNYTNDWDGRYNGKVLDEGAYYYVVDYGDGTKPVTGMLNIIHRHH